VLLKYAPDGALAWKLRYDSGYDDVAAALARDRDGDLLIAATSRANPSAGPENDILVLRVGGGGNLVWEQRWGAENRTDDKARAIYVDSGGNVHVMGEGRGAPGTPDEGAVGFVHLKFDARGNLLWQRGATREDERISTVANVLFGEGGMAVVSGTVRQPDGATFVRTILQDENGLVRWTDTTWPCGPGDGLASLAWAPGSHILASGTARWAGTDQDIFLEEYEPSGKPLATRAFHGGVGTDFSRGMTVLDGSPIVVGQAQSKRSHDLAVVRFR
jgi:hypothetical protein